MNEEKPVTKLGKIVERRIPENLKIIYYGPITKEESSVSKGHLSPQNKCGEQNSRKGLKSLEGSSPKKETDSKDRYYDLDTTVESSTDAVNLTYYPMAEREGEQQ